MMAQRTDNVDIENLEKLSKEQLKELAQAYLSDREKRRKQSREYHERQKEKGLRRLSIYVPDEYYSEARDKIRSYAYTLVHYRGYNSVKEAFNAMERDYGNNQNANR
jgi:hypothetical protein